MRDGGADGEAVRVDVGDLRPLGEVQQQIGVLDGSDGVVDVVEVGVCLAGGVQGLGAVTVTSALSSWSFRATARAGESRMSSVFGPKAARADDICGCRDGTAFRSGSPA
jgi:hypothetical protein